MIESGLQRKCLREAEARGWLGYKISSNVSGLPDTILISPEGGMLWVEFKSPKNTGRLSKLQEYRHRELARNCCKVHVIASYDEFCALIDAQ